MHVDSATQDVLDDLAGAADLARTGGAIAARTGVDGGAVVGVLTELARIGWVFGGPDYWQLTGVGHSHTSHPRRGGLLGN
ncbi:MAG: hypothetical protein OEO17_03645 [Gemmatimonadota bacterium]|nr:hypothetical protein [Gemmatimonadota bacterium]